MEITTSTTDMKTWYQLLGAKGGRSTSKKKREAARRNVRKAQAARRKKPLPLDNASDL